MKNKIIQIFSLFFLFFLLSWNGIAQTTWYVNDNSLTGDTYTSAVGDDNNAGIAAAPFLTIQKAVNSAADGDEIKVDVGSYTEEITVNKRLTIIGAGSGSNPLANTVITGTTLNVPVVKIRTGGLSVSDRATIKDVYVTTSASNTISWIGGIEIDASNNNPLGHITLENVTVANCPGKTTGIHFKGVSATKVSTDIISDVKIINSLITNNQYGISARHTQVHGLEILGGSGRTVISENRRAGMLIYGVDNGSGFSNQFDDFVLNKVDFYHNNTSGDLDAGNGDIFFLGFNGDLDVDDVVITMGNTAAANPYYIGFGINGKYLGGSEPAGNMTFKNLKLNDYADAQQHPRALMGIWTFSNLNAGVELDGVEFNGTGATQGALSLSGLYGTTPLVIKNSKFAGLSSYVFSPANQITDIRSVGSYVPVDATNNNTFTGTSDNFDIEDRIIHKIDNASYGLVTWVATHRYVTPNSYLPNITTTPDVQRGVDAASNGDIVHIEAGAYIGNVDATAKTVTLSPGASPGCVTINGNVSLNGGDVMYIEADNTTACTGYDQFIVNGSVSLGGATLDLTLGYTPALGDSYTIISNDGSDAVVGQFAQGAAITVLGYTFSINYAGGDGNDVVLTRCSGGVQNTNTGEIFCTIQSAIDDAQTLTGHTITVSAGTYNEAVTVNKGVTIKGAGKGSDPLTNTILSAPIPCSGTGFYVTAANVTLQNMRVTNFQTAVQLYSVAPSLTNLALVDYCSYGIRLAGTNSTVAITNTDIQRTTFLLGTVGIRAGTADAVNGMTIDSTTITGNVWGIAVFQATTPVAFDNIIIKNSTISNNTQKGIYLEKLSNSSFENLTMDNNGTDAGYGFNNGIDINLKYGSYTNITIKDCDITNSGVTGTASDPQNPAAVAIKARDDAPSYSANPATLSNVTIKNNRITGPQNGIRIGEFGKTNATPTNVVIEGNELSYAFANKAIISRINADIAVKCNWHGATDFPTVLSGFSKNGSGNLVLSTVLSNGTDTSPGTPGFQPAGTCIGPVHNITQNTYYGTIQSAIDNVTTVDNDVIKVVAGTYVENIVVNKKLTILGPNANVDPCSGTRVPEAIIYPPVSDIAYNTDDGALIDVQASDVTISGFLLDGDNPGISTGYTSTNGADIDAASGIVRYSTGNNLVVTNNIIQNLSYFGVTLYDYPAGVPSAGNIIANNKIQDLGTYDAGSGIAYWGGGILLYNNQYAHIHNNCMENVRVGVQTGNFSQANPGLPISQVIENNTIQARRRGIFHNLFYSNASGYTLSNNTITGLMNSNETVWDGILLASLSVPSTTSGNTINGTGITNPSEGIEVWNVKNTTPATISGGSISNVNTGIFINNYEGYNGNAELGAHATVTGPMNITPNATGIGVRLLDSPSSTTHDKVNATVTNVTINGGIEGIKLDQTTEIGAAVGGSFSYNTISSSGVGINVARAILSGSNALSISNNTISNASQNLGGNPTVGISLTNISGSVVATVSDNNISGPFYGYAGYNINTTPVSTIDGGTVSGIMQGISIINTDGVLTKGSSINVKDVTMSGFTGTSSNPAINFHAGIYTFTTAGTTVAEGITMNIDGVTIGGTGKPSQASGGIYLADFSGGSNNVQTITVNNSTIQNNANRGFDARGKVNLTLTTNTISNNGYDAWGAGGNYGYSVIAQQEATITATNNFINLPATSSTEVFGLFTGNGTTNSITAHNNSILLNGNTNVNSRLAKSAPGTGSMDATCNWWGTLVVNNLAALIEGNVTYTPWLINGTDDQLGTPGFQPASGTCSGVPVAITVGTITHVLCKNGANGSIDITASGGTAPYTYLWSNGQTVQDAINLAAGSYAVTATDIYGNTAVSTNLIVTEPAALVINNYIIMNETCQSCNNGSITINAMGGTPAYEYSIDNGTTWHANSYFPSLQAGNYTVIVKDANGCQTVPDVVTITEPGVYPDLTPSHFLSTSTFANPETSDVVIRIRNIGTGPTTSAFTFTVSKFSVSSGFVLSLVDANVTPVIQIGPNMYTLHHSDFVISETLGFYIFTTKPGVYIPNVSSGFKNVGFTLTRTGGSNGQSNITSNIDNNSGGETVNSNNIGVSELVKN